MKLKIEKYIIEEDATTTGAEIQIDANTQTEARSEGPIMDAGLQSGDDQDVDTEGHTKTEETYIPKIQNALTIDLVEPENIRYKTQYLGKLKMVHEDLPELQKEQESNEDTHRMSSDEWTKMIQELLAD